jgi:hypothetical protein
LRLKFVVLGLKRIRVSVGVLHGKQRRDVFIFWKIDALNWDIVLASFVLEIKFARLFLREKCFLICGNLM